MTGHSAANALRYVQRDTRLNVANKECAAGTLALYTFFNNRLVHLIVSFTFWTTLGQPRTISSRTAVTLTCAI